MSEIVPKIDQVLDQDTTFSEKLQAVTTILAESLSTKKCSIMIINQEDLSLEVRASTNPAIIGCKKKLSEVSIATRALLDDEPFLLDEKRQVFFQQQVASKYAFQQAVSIPIKYLNKKVGVINFADMENNQPFSEEQARLAICLAEYLSPFVYATQTTELLEKKLKRLEAANKRFRELDELKANLTAFIVHDLKGPISTIMANLDMLNYEPLTPQQFEYVNFATEDVNKMLNMVMNILDVLKLEEGKIKIYREETDIYALAQREADSNKNVLSRLKLNILVEGEPLLCYIDELLIGRVIQNLLRNAIDYSPEGGKLILKIQHDKGNKEIVVSIADEGRGVPDEQKEKIFDKFFQVDGESHERKASTGLGLTYCKLVVDAHGGKIRVEDTEGGGAKFIFTVPETLGGTIH